MYSGLLDGLRKVHAAEGLRGLLRGAYSDEQISGAIAHIWQARSDRYSQLRSAQGAELPAGQRRVEMSYIGG